MKTEMIFFFINVIKNLKIFKIRVKSAKEITGEAFISLRRKILTSWAFFMMYDENLSDWEKYSANK